ncbi:MAG: hypothetical protein ACFBSE_19190 [Prochloraceae cyanobacterium]
MSSPPKPILDLIKIAKEQSLKKLDLSYNTTNYRLGSIPSEIFTLKDLNQLNLSGNGLKTIPESLGKLT